MATCTSGGYDYNFVNPPIKSLECSICLSVVRDPHVTSCCGNHFCQLCINPIQQGNRPCPLCNESDYTTFLHKGVAREVNALKIYCSNKPLGCDWVGELGQVEKHLNPEDESMRERGCGFVMVDCKYKCGGQFQRQLVRKHEAESCHKSPFKPASDNMALLFKKLDALETDIQELKLANKIANNEISALKVENATLKQQIELRPLPPVLPFYFTLNNYKHYDEIDYIFFSPPFYSHYGGYKLRFKIECPRDYYLSIYLHIMVGEYDDKLKWPVKIEATVEMYNWHRKQWREIDSITTKVLSRPTECISRKAGGIPEFLSSHRLNQHYLRSDSIKFRATRVQLI